MIHPRKAIDRMTLQRGGLEPIFGENCDKNALIKTHTQKENAKQIRK